MQINLYHMKILCTNFYASIIKCTNLIFFAAKQPDYNGNTTTLLLHFDPLKTSHAGTYTCVSSISKPISIKIATWDLLVQSKSFNSLSLPIIIGFVLSL